MEQEKITEADNKHQEWFKEAKGMTEEKLPDFMARLIHNYQHDYGTICHAASAAAVAAATAIHKSPSGGITGFQAGCIMWGFISHWNYGGEPRPMRLLDYQNLLYPQYEDDFNKTISTESFEWLQKQAAEKLSVTQEHVSPNVISHWRSIVAGQVPFGFALKD